MFVVSSLDKAIVATLAYASVKDWPLTSWEIFRYLISLKKFEERNPSFLNKPLKLKDVIDRLDFLRKKKIVETKDSFWFLKENQARDLLITSRIARESLCDQKWRLLKKRERLLKSLPFIRGVLVSGSLACNWVREESDFDLLLISASDRIWTARFFANFFLACLGLKRTDKKIKNRFCLNHFITTAALRIPFKSLYNAWTYVHLVPLLEQERGVFAAFQKENSWVTDYLFWGFGPGWQDQRKARISPREKSLQKLFEALINFFLGNFWEKFFKKVQIYHIKKQPSSFREEGGRVTLSETQLEFHPNSPEKETLQAYNQKIKSLNLFRYEPEKDSGLF